MDTGCGAVPLALRCVRIAYGGYDGGRAWEIDRGGGSAGVESERSLADYAEFLHLGTPGTSLRTPPYARCAWAGLHRRTRVPAHSPPALSRPSFSLAGDKLLTCATPPVSWGLVSCGVRGAGAGMIRWRVRKSGWEMDAVVW